MILTCPECATRFKIADDAIGANGRTVRCSQCSATWFVAAEPDVLALDEAEEVTEIREEIIRDPVENIGGKHATDTGADLDEIDDTRPHDDVGKNVADVGAHALIREQADRKKARRRIFGVGMIWLVTLAILALFALLAYVFRAPIVEKFPGTAPIYQAFGLEANAGGLTISIDKTSYGNNEGVPVLFVNGKVKNIDRKTRDVKMIKLSFKNEAGEVIASWVVEPAQSRLKPGKTLDFATQYPNPPIDAVKLAPNFVKETDARSEATKLSQ